VTLPPLEPALELLAEADLFAPFDAVVPFCPAADETFFGWPDPPGTTST
jgi:hypothetical protein